MRACKAGKKAYTVQAVTNALEILELLVDQPTTPTLGWIAEALGLSRNKAFRLLETLRERGLVERDVETGMYLVGVAAVELSQKLLRRAPVVAHAHPVIEEIARRHDETVYMTVLRGDSVVFVDMADSDRQVKPVTVLGKRFPYFTNAAGKAMKALESVDPLNLLRKPGRRKKSLNVELLANELADIREKGVAVDFGGLGEGIVSVAVAVRDYAGKVVGAITILVPAFRIVADRLDNEIIPSLREGAEILSMKFGHAPC